MSGWKYLGAKRWWEVTRDERFFCARLYALTQAEPGRLIRAFNLANKALALAEDDDWEIGLEVCFFRDFWHGKNRTEEYYSPKRTFDLCLFSSTRVVVIEAKAQQDFGSDRKQLAAFHMDIEQVEAALGLSHVDLVLLGSSRASPEAVLDDVNLPPERKFAITWKSLSAALENDEVLLRADGLYKPDHMSGRELMDHEGENLLIGCQQGEAGLRRLLEGDWQSVLFEVRRSSSLPPNRNWFTLDAFREIARNKGLI